MPVIPSDTVRIDERPDADSVEVQERIATATDGVDHATDPTRRAEAGAEGRAFGPPELPALPGRERRRAASSEAQVPPPPDENP